MTKCHSLKVRLIVQCEKYGNCLSEHTLLLCAEVCHVALHSLHFAAAVHILNYLCTLLC